MRRMARMRRLVRGEGIQEEKERWMRSPGEVAGDSEASGLTKS